MQPPEVAEHADRQILVVDDHAAARQSMSFILSRAGYRVDSAASAAGALKRIASQPYDVVLTDLQMPGMDGLQLLGKLRELRCDAAVALVTAHGSVPTAVEAMRQGAVDYVEKPFDAAQLEALVARALDHPATRRPLESEWELLGESPPMQRLREQILRVAQTDETVLIIGESGTGKELIARAVHAHSRRAESPLIGLNCPALSPALMESELFGHEQGAFTGAERQRVGRFELAHGGALLLDEVTEIDPPLQAKLLRVLQERTFERVGASRSIDVNVRLLATTNRDLRGEMQAGRFRQDLYFRLAVLPIQAPALRERPEDVPLLAEHFLAAASARMDREPLGLADAAAELLSAYRWPGNVRELENLMTRAAVMTAGDRVTADALRPWLLAGDGGEPEHAGPQVVGDTLEQMERKLIEATLDHYDGHRVRTAEALGIGVRTLTNKLRSYGLPPRATTFSRAG